MRWNLTKFLFAWYSSNAVTVMHSRSHMIHNEVEFTTLYDFQNSHAFHCQRRFLVTPHKVWAHMIYWVWTEFVLLDISCWIHLPYEKVNSDTGTSQVKIVQFMCWMFTIVFQTYTSRFTCASVNCDIIFSRGNFNLQTEYIMLTAVLSIFTDWLSRSHVKPETVVLILKNPVLNRFNLL